MTADEAKQLTLKNLEGKSGSTDILAIDMLDIFDPYCTLNKELYPHDSDACIHCPVQKICYKIPDTFEEINQFLKELE